ncbi:SPFH domain-containing protein [Paraburkholderia sp. BL25I1N1]|uniref:SPFH domain-containing protein n=1 Tax=Paraburkholderia sp. BL25I1N1 TaxID=1938804 RepID=UPI000D07B9A9|nr:SPFH domain-containing protein [Paraburkholderia sp. BL25I1N1]PRY04878.1 membrane protease subunit (stomatin/prohibitin family) [Paraburkholderia sp. BL25I1N1]
MSLGSFIRKQFVDVLQWTEDGDGVLAWRYPMEDQEIQYGAQLTVRESQMALFINEGRIADVFGPGLYTLTTRTLPVLTSLRNWDKLFQSPFKSDVYFFSTRLQLGRRWGTPQPVTIRDREFGLVQVRAFGIYSYRVVDVPSLHREISGTRAVYTVDDLEQQLRNLVVTAMSVAFGSADVAFVDMAANQEALSQRIGQALAPVFARYGVALDSFTVQSVSLPEALQKALDARISVGVSGDLNKFAQYQAAQSIPLAAQNPGGVAGVGAGIAAGAAIAQSMTGALNQSAQTQPAQASASNDYVERLQQLKTLLDKGLVTEDDYAKAKAEILAKLTQ